MTVILQSRIYRADLRANPDVLFVFGDNSERWGRGGQAAEMRDEPNAVGVATLWAPGRFFSEGRVEEQCRIIDADMTPLFDAARAGRIIVFPLDGIGTGLAALEANSPTTFAHLLRQIEALKSTKGEI